MPTPDPSSEPDAAPHPGQDSPPPVTPPVPPHVVVVGGGIAGLVAAWELVRAGVRVTLLEAADHLGGKVMAHTVAGVVLDAGAESFATREGTVAALAGELGLGASVVRPDAGGAWLRSADGRSLPLPRAGLLGIPAVPLAADVIAIVGLRGALRAQLDSLMGGFVGSRERTLGALVRKRMGRAVLDRLVTPVAGSIHSSHPDQLDVDVVAPRLRAAMLSEGSLSRAILTIRAVAPAGSAVQGIEGGVFRLVEALASELRESVDMRLGTPVAAFETGAVTTAGGERIEADHIVLAAPLGAASGAPIVIVTLVVADAGHGSAPDGGLDAAPRGTGVLVAQGGTPPPSGSRAVAARALTHATAKWPWLLERSGGRHVIRLSYERASGSEAEVRDRARRDAAELLGVPIPPEAVLGFARVDWTGPPRVDRVTVPGVTEVGERITGAGLAAVIRYTRAESRSLSRTLLDDSGLR